MIRPLNRLFRGFILCAHLGGLHSYLYFVLNINYLRGLQQAWWPFWCFTSLTDVKIRFLSVFRNFLSYVSKFEPTRLSSLSIVSASYPLQYARPSSLPLYLKDLGLLKPIVHRERNDSVLFYRKPFSRHH
jgi:hypothetical protein